MQEYQSADWEFPVWVTPGISTFVGGDIVAGLYALNMLPEGTASQVRMLIDLGTNGEMAITDGIEMVVTATAAGPAFEGGAGAGIIGSDMIANVAALLQRGVLDETGLLEEPYFTKGIMVGEPPVHMNNKDIRDLQMAKAAVRAGVEILWKKLGCPEIGRGLSCRWIRLLFGCGSCFSDRFAAGAYEGQGIRSRKYIFSGSISYRV